MISRIFLLNLLFPVLLAAQEKMKTILVIPLSNKNIKLSSLTERNIKYNHASIDTLNDFIVTDINAQVPVLFKNYSVHFLQEYYSAATLPDTLYDLKKWNCFYIASKDSSYKIIKKSKVTSLDSYHNNYLGYELNAQGTAILKQAIKASNCGYILFVSKFEIITPNSIFSLHVELMDNNLKKIYGNKNESERIIGKTMYYDVLKYFCSSSNTEMLKMVEEYLDQVVKP